MMLIMMPKVSSWFSCPILIVLAQLTALAVEEVAGQGITRFASIEHPVDRPAVGRGPAVLARGGS
jgi:hypothetical protein